MDTLTRHRNIATVSKYNNNVSTIYYMYLYSYIAVFYKKADEIYQMNLLCIDSSKMSSCEPVDICDVCAKTPGDMLRRLQLENKWRTECKAVSHTSIRECAMCKTSDENTIFNNRILKKMFDDGIKNGEKNMVVDISAFKTFSNNKYIREIYKLSGLSWLHVFLEKIPSGISSIHFKPISAISKLNRASFLDNDHHWTEENCFDFTTIMNNIKTTKINNESIVGIHDQILLYNTDPPIQTAATANVPAGYVDILPAIHNFFSIYLKKNENTNGNTTINVMSMLTTIFISLSYLTSELAK